MKSKIVIAIVIFALTGCSTSFFNLSTPTPTGPTPTPLSEQQIMDQIQTQVISIRGLQPTGSVTRGFLSSAQLHEKVINDFFKDYTAADQAKDLRELSLLGLLNSNFDLHTLYIDLYSEQIAGYYDPQTKTMYIVSDATFDGQAKDTYAHEYTHVLQDQNYDLLNGLKNNPEYCKTHTEYCAGVDALVEGDAVNTESAWLMLYASAQDKQDIVNFYSVYKSPVYDSAPAFMKEDFIFPYNQGATFVQYLLSKGNEAAVDEAFKNPPVDTEQILHPELYPSDSPIDVQLPDFTATLGNGWAEETRNVMGEWYIYLIFADGLDTRYQLAKTTAQSAAAGWGGDTYLLYYNSTTNQSAFIMRSQWDTMQDADQYWTALVDYSTARWGKPNQNQNFTVTWLGQTEGVVTIKRNGNDVLWLITPDQTIANSMIANVPNF
jgi:hypothetical protein